MFSRSVRGSFLALLTLAAVICALRDAVHPATLAFAAPAPLFSQSHDLIPGSTGVDVSWPQCDSQRLPVDILSFAIIGVNGGRITSLNDCLEGQYQWALSARAVPHVYMNTNAPPAGYVSAGCAPTDAPCNSYWFGYSHAVVNVNYARAKHADALHWWLDVETGNFWTTDTAANAKVIQGAIDYLKQTGHIVGIYSTPRQWGIIAGNYAPGLPNWTAGAANLAEAPARCSEKYAFGGGTVVLVQYVSEEYDTNYVCPGNTVRRMTVTGVVSGIEHAD
jgi:hypothetical protein